MKTPICDFLRAYDKSGMIRAHMPGHKGKSPDFSALLGAERFDLTEVNGADSLYEADGIIRESEANASELFGAHTFYSAEGSSLSIRAMLYLSTTLSACSRTENDKKPLVLAGRNAHKTFVSAAAMLDFDVEWLTGDGSYLSCMIDAKALEAKLSSLDNKPVAVYVTSPDYLGNMLDIRSLAEVCHRHGALLLVDNAHGAYLKFSEPSRHPIDCGADMCCDSAHKTLPTLTGAAYLHISKALAPEYAQNAKRAMALFGSTSPSYLILASLDACNQFLADNAREAFAKTVKNIESLRERLTSRGYSFASHEPLKLTVEAKKHGYTGVELASLLRAQSIECEFCDSDYLVLMLSPFNSEAELQLIENALLAIPPRTPITDTPPTIILPERVLSIREAMLSPCETIPVENACGRILANATVACPPAVPIIVGGERISDNTIAAFQYYSITECSVLL